VQESSYWYIKADPTRNKIPAFGDCHHMVSYTKKVIIECPRQLNFLSSIDVCREYWTVLRLCVSTLQHNLVKDTKQLNENKITE